MTHSNNFGGKVALITGAGKGIGRQCAIELAKRGAEVIAVARTEADLESLKNEVAGSVRTWAIDATRNELLDRIANERALDVLVNNVGTNRPEPFLEVSEENLDALLSLNIRSAFRVAQAAARVMARQNSGTIVHITSQMGHVGAANRTVYCMTKHAIEGLSKAMAIELASTGIRVNTVAPTFIETPMTRPMLDNPDFKEEVIRKIPLGQLGQVSDVAEAVCYLASSAAKMVTGTSLRVDGGWTAI